MTFEHITLHNNGDVAILTLNRPGVLNALHSLMIEEIDTALETARQSARALLLTGAGRGFCSGADLTATAASGVPDTGALLDSHFNPLTRRLATYDLPIVAAVNGIAAGAGCSLALLADFVLAAHSASFVQSFVSIGLVPDMGASWLLPRLIGVARARAWMLLGDPLDAATAHHWGLLHATHPDEALFDQALALAQRLARGPTTAYRLTRQGLHAALACSFDDALEIERDNQRRAGQTADFREGLAAFAGKRTPRFTGC